VKPLLLSLSIRIYSAVFYVLTSVFRRLDRKDILHGKERTRAPDVTLPEGGKPVVWIHAASLGESKIAIAFLSLLKKKREPLLFVLTALSESGVNYIRTHASGPVVYSGFMPVDTLSHTGRFIDAFSISRVWLVETEIWPGLLWTCFKRKIPVGIVNGRMEKKSFRKYKKFRYLLSPLFNGLDILLVQNQEYAQRFIAMGAQSQRVVITGNIKSHINVKPVSENEKNALREKKSILASDIVITAGCIHPGEAAIIQKAAHELTRQGLCWKWILVPRHINKSPLILKELSGDVAHVTDINAFPAIWHICVVEAFGVLETMYRIADAAILGGTFTAIGGHNVWEPIQFGLPLFFGPDFHTQQESGEKLLKAHVGFCVGDYRMLADALKIHLTKEKDFLRKNLALFSETMNSSFRTFEGYIP
jgi:3-deoxy-D-manno-octulosonic-acid transferase